MKIALIIGIALSTLLVLLGAFFKIQSWEGGSYFILIGMVGEVVCIAGLAIHLVTSGKTPDDGLDLDPGKVSSGEKEAAKILNDNDQFV